MASPKYGLGKLYMAAGRLDEAEDLLTFVYDARKETYKENDWQMGDVEVALGEFHLKRGNTAEAARLLKSGHEKLAGKLGEQSYLAQRAAGLIAGL